MASYPFSEKQAGKVVPQSHWVFLESNGYVISTNFTILLLMTRFFKVKVRLFKRFARRIRTWFHSKVPCCYMSPQSLLSWDCWSYLPRGLARVSQPPLCL